MDATSRCRRWLFPRRLPVRPRQARHEIYREEIFGPVLGVVRVNNLQEAMDMIDAHEYGNGTCIFTRDGEAARYLPTISRSAWWASTCRCQCRSRIIRSAAGSARCSATWRPMARTRCASIPSARHYSALAVGRLREGPCLVSIASLNPESSRRTFEQYKDIYQGLSRRRSAQAFFEQHRIQQVECMFAESPATRAAS